MSIKFAPAANIAANLVTAINSGDENAQAQAWEAFASDIAEQVRAEYDVAMAANDRTVLAARGFHQLSSAEEKFYNKLIADLKDGDKVRQSYTTSIDILSDSPDVMPVTIVEDVYRGLTEEHPLLSAISFQFVGYLTKWVLNNHTTDSAAWGAVTSAISEQITSAFQVVDITQAKLSCFAAIAKDMLELGPVFLDAYIRAILKESMAVALENGIVNGTGKNQPIGLIADLSNYSAATGYAAKTAEEVTAFDPVTYGELLATIATNEHGRNRAVPKVSLIVNQADYFEKIMPAVTVASTNGYITNLFPFPTDVIISNAVASNHAILAYLPDYVGFAGGPKEGTIEFDDSLGFLDDCRYFKIKQFFFGRPLDNNVALYLDISDLAPNYLTVKTITAVEVPDAE